MKNWQKYWLYFLIFYSSLHLIRDILQDFGINTFLSNLLVKTPLNPLTGSILWAPFNTYIIAVAEIVLAAYCLKRKKFGWTGILTLFVAVTTVFAWLFYWFFL